MRIKAPHTHIWLASCPEEEHLLISNPENGKSHLFFLCPWPLPDVLTSHSNQMHYFYTHHLYNMCGWCLSVCTANMLTSAGGYIEVTVSCPCSSRREIWRSNCLLSSFLFTHPCGTILDRKSRCLERSK